MDNNEKMKDFLLEAEAKLAGLPSSDGFLILAFKKWFINKMAGRFRCTKKKCIKTFNEWGDQMGILNL